MHDKIEMISNVFDCRRPYSFHLHLLTKVLGGYARKSPTSEDVACKTILNSMITNLKERSFVTAPLESRDLQPNLQAMIKGLNADGNTQDLLTYLKIT